MSTAELGRSPVPCPRVLVVEGLEVSFAAADGRRGVVHGVSFDIARGELVGLVGESGSGKTTTALALLGLLPAGGHVTAGRAVLNGGDDVLDLAEDRRRRLRWCELALIPQGAMSSLNPTMRIGAQLSEVIVTHERRGRRDRGAVASRVNEAFARVGLPRRIGAMYPHELSGGMKQRVCIAMAIVLQPSLIVADEPTSALDVVVQRVVAQTLIDIKSDNGPAILMIGHDIGLMAQVADRVAVMFAGRIVEIGPVDEVLRRPKHPYTQALVASVPSFGTPRGERAPDRAVPAEPANASPDRVTGCPYRGSCAFAMDECATTEPTLRLVGGRHEVSCHLFDPSTEPAPP